MNTRPIPEPWAGAMLKAGLVRGEAPSLRALATKAGVSPETVSRLVHGRGTSVDTVNAVADALGRSRTTVSAWAGQERTVEEHYEAPPEAALLNARQRAALTELIRAIAETTPAGVELAREIAATTAEVQETVGQSGPLGIAHGKRRR